MQPNRSSIAYFFVTMCAYTLIPSWRAIMKSSRAALVAAAIPLVLTSFRVTAGELPFTAPATEQARESALLLHQTARALQDSSSAATARLIGNQQISNLWLFPTAEANTVFARYNLTPPDKETSDAGQATREHLTVLTIRDSRIVESNELTSAPAELVSRHSPSLDPSATIGTGYAAHAKETNSPHGVPSSPDWTARIGTGTAATSRAGVGEIGQPVSSSAQPVTAVAHWTSRIGRGDAFESSKPVAHVPLADAR